mmetsp:Transcript_32783/g.71529  ORF Transcript_32783/g.71529 Transcript_32783/m.71529 type:complete len:211 (+) Transcript_32783:184-816(+)
MHTSLSDDGVLSRCYDTQQSACLPAPQQYVAIFSSANSKGVFDLTQLGHQIMCLCNGIANVVHGSKLKKLGLCFFRDVLQIIHKFLHGFLCDPLPACEGLQLFIRLWHCIASHHCLDRLCQHLPVGVEVAVHGLRVRQHLGDAPQCALVTQNRLRKPNAEVADHRTVRQVALPPRDGQLVGEVIHDSVGDAKVALTVLKVNGVDLMRHGG